MRTLFFTTATLVSVAAISPPAHAIGCLSGGAAGALAGHMAGHGILGAVGGCIAGHQWHKHQQQLREQDLQNQAAYDARRRAIDPNYQSPWQ
jgi:outer membrane lipoprotein SlyB